MEAGKQVRYEPRRVSEKALTMALADVVFTITGSHLSKVSLCILLAQMGQEQGIHPDGSRDFPNYNGFGIKWTPGNDFFEAVTPERAEMVRERKKFRAYASLEDGLRSYVSLLAKQPRYARGWERLVAGDYDGFVEEIGPHYLPNGKQDPHWGGYFEAPTILYRAGVRRHWAACALRMANYGTVPDEIRRFQKDHGINVDGALGPQTRGALRLALGGDGQP